MSKQSKTPSAREQRLAEARKQAQSAERRRSLILAVGQPGADEERQPVLGGGEGRRL